MRRVLLLLFAAAPVCAYAQAPAPTTAAATPAAERAAVEPVSLSGVPVRRVVLYKTGVGYFEHLGNVRDRQNISVRFTSAQLNDVLNSLTVMDLGKGQITGISYNSVAPLSQRLGALRLPVDQNTSRVQLLGALRGARVEVNAGSGAIEGRLLGLEQRARDRAGETTPIDILSILTDAGELRSFELSSTVRLRIVDRGLREEMGRYLDLVGSTREQDVRTMVISTTGTGERPLFVSYVSEVPIWKSTYRLVLRENKKPFLQGWAVIDNTIGEDWRNVELSLVAGAPQSFIQNISQPLYGRRPVVPMPAALTSAPQTHDASLGDGAGTISGTVRDSSGAPLPGARVRLVGTSGAGALVLTRNDGGFEMTAPAGIYSLRVELPGFATQSIDNWRVTGGGADVRDVTMQVASAAESVSVGGQVAMGRGSAAGAGLGGGIGDGVLGGVVGGVPSPPPPPSAQVRVTGSEAAPAPLGDLFEYRLKEPITLAKNQSALVPIMSAEVDAEKVSVWNRASGSGRPLRALWLTNASGLTLDGGSVSVIDGDAFAGEGLIAPLKSGEKRLLSYAADTGVLVDARTDQVPARVSRVSAHDGILKQETEERITAIYRARNENPTPTTLIIEHRLASGWKLAPGQTPAESTADAQRFRVVLPPAKETAFEVRQLRRGESVLMVGNLDSQFIAQLATNGVAVADVERALKPVLDKKAEVAALERRVESLLKDRNTISQDQNRLRENMKALRGSREEKALLQRYARQLNEQETRLDELQAQLARATGDVERVRGELSALIAHLSFDWTAG
jgi:hypothetical protein